MRSLLGHSTKVAAPVRQAAPSCEPLWVILVTPPLPLRVLMASTAISPGDWHSSFAGCSNPVHTFKNYSHCLSPMTLFECAIRFAKHPD